MSDAPYSEALFRAGPIALAFLAFVALFRVSDVLMGAMSRPFYIDTGFTLEEIGTFVGVYGLFATIAGALAGGVIVARYGLMRPLLVGAVLLPATNLLFALLGVIGPEIWMLIVTITADNLSAGFAGTVFILYTAGAGIPAVLLVLFLMNYAGGERRNTSRAAP